MRFAETATASSRDAFPAQEGDHSRGSASSGGKQEDVKAATAGSSPPGIDEVGDHQGEGTMGSSQQDPTRKRDLEDRLADFQELHHICRVMIFALFADMPVILLSNDSPPPHTSHLRPHVGLKFCGCDWSMMTDLSKTNGNK